MQHQYQIVKFVGLTAKQLAALHKAVEDLPASKNHFRRESLTTGLFELGNHKFAHIMSAKMDEKHKTYTIEVRIMISIAAHEITPPDSKKPLDGGGQILVPAGEIMKRIYEAIGSTNDEELICWSNA